MAKKRKGARPTKKASRSVKKKAAKKASAPKMAAKQITGLEDPARVDFNPLKQHMGKHIARLESAKIPSDRIASALRILKQAQADLSRECLPTMELATS